ncbi:MAG: response regulator [Anaerolineae bacterium]|nr:response regulator [Anaerolineae bacterium]
MVPQLDREQFSKWVSEALKQLYDSPSLGKHPLAELFARAEGGVLDRAQNLRRIFLEVIQSLRPKAGTPVDSPDWRAYRILEMRYLEGLSPDEAMLELALQKSQYFRDQARALELVGDCLWQRYRSSFAKDAEAEPEDLLRLELKRLYEHAAWDTVDLKKIIEELSSVVVPLAQERGVDFINEIISPLQVRYGSRVILRQAMLNLFLLAMEIGSRGKVRLSSSAEGELTLEIYPSEGQTLPSLSSEQERRLSLAQELIAATRGQLVQEAHSAKWILKLNWQEVENVLLVIDDNQGFLELFHRYLEGHNWRVVCASGGAEARKLVRETKPSVIILDVLMPQEDGWELLVSLKKAPETRHIPIIVCSVLPEADLALSLGAAAYLPKPVSERSLLQALAPWQRLNASPVPKQPGSPQ